MLEDLELAAWSGLGGRNLQAGKSSFLLNDYAQPLLTIVQSKYNYLACICFTWVLCALRCFLSPVQAVSLWLPRRWRLLTRHCTNGATKLSCTDKFVHCKLFLVIWLNQCYVVQVQAGPKTQDGVPKTTNLKPNFFRRLQKTKGNSWCFFLLTCGVSQVLLGELGVGWVGTRLSYGVEGIVKM